MAATLRFASWRKNPLFDLISAPDKELIGLQLALFIFVNSHLFIVRYKKNVIQNDAESLE
jgi:hypothetical protein